jgi:hypothetical protein
MRKEDRIRHEQNREENQTRPQSSPSPREQEQMRGSASTGERNTPPRPSGKLPLPD